MIKYNLWNTWLRKYTYLQILKIDKQFNPLSSFQNRTQIDAKYPYTYIRSVTTRYSLNPARFKAMS